MSKVEPLSFDLTTGRHDPKETVLPEIREQYPWHWDPMKQDHDDGKGLIGNWSDKLDWEGLSKWCIEKVNKMRLPNKWWDYNYETGFIHMVEMMQPILQYVNRHY